jgi:hypothetical protein
MKNDDLRQNEDIYFFLARNLKKPALTHNNIATKTNVSKTLL